METMEKTSSGFLLNFLFIGLIWGITNPLIKRGSCGINQRHNKSNSISQFFSEISYLIFNWRFVLPYLVSQIGSILYYVTIQNSNLTVAVPVTNALTFLFTAITGWMLGEEKIELTTIFGMILIIAGIIFCITEAT